MSTVRRLVILAGVFSVVISAALADTIRLKNGTFLNVDRVRDKGDSYEYVMGGATYTIAKKFVERVETGAGPSISIGSAVPTTQVIPDGGAISVSVTSSDQGAKPMQRGHEKIAVRTPSPPADANEAALLLRITNVGHIDAQALAAIEREGNAYNSAMAYFVAGKHQLEQGQFEDACRYFHQAVNLQPDRAALVEWYAGALTKAGRYNEALSQAERATQLAPNDADAFWLLGLVSYNSDRTHDAVRAWKRSLELHPEPSVQEWLAKAQRELAVEGNYRQRESNHFSLHYEGRETSLGLPGDILETLEVQFRELARDLDYTPTANIAVILYTEKNFFDVTQAPSWAGGLNDGKLRIPIKGVQTMNPELQHVLKHELAHSFIHQITHGRCPGWLNEGLAQMLEPQPVYEGAFLAGLYGEGKELRFRDLETQFSVFNDVQARVAYAESLAAVDYLKSRYGMGDIERMLQRIGNGESSEAALRATTRDNYEQFQSELGKYLEKTYGRGE